jgi:hypothetical protein
MMTRKKEQKSWDNFKSSLNPRTLKPYRIENLYTGDGMPDVLMINRRGVVFWLENKALDGWPARESTCPLKSVFEAGQLGFGRQWMEWNGLSFVLLRVGLDFFLMDPRDNLQFMTQTDIYGHCIAHGKIEIIKYLENLKHED